MVQSERAVCAIFRAELTCLIGAESIALIDIGKVVITRQEIAPVRTQMDWIVLFQKPIGRVGVILEIRVQQERIECCRFIGIGSGIQRISAPRLHG